MPHNAVDPILLASRIVLSLQTIVSRENNPIDPVVITVGSIHGGTQANIIPDEVKLELSVRTFTTQVRTRTLAAIRRIAKGEADAAGATREPLVVAPATARPPVVNDPALIARLAVALKSALGDQNVVEMPAKMTSEDFAEYGRVGVPAVLLHVGAVAPARLAESKRTGNPVPAPHSPEWLPALEPTLKGAIQAETAALVDLLR
jgi:hippurate hydrolase